MKKKQIIGLSTLLLVCLLGLFTTSYAMSVSQAEDCMLYITDQYNASYTPYYKICVPALIDSNLWEQHKNEIGFDTYNTIIMRCKYESTTVRVEFITLNVDNTYINQTFIKFTTDNATLTDIRICRFNMTRQGIVNSFSIFNDSLSYNSIRRDPTDMSVWCGAVIQANNIENTTDYFYYGKGYSAQMPFTFIPKPTSQFADVYYFEDVPLYNASGEDLYLGQLFVPSDSIITYWTKDNYYFRYNDWNMRQLPSDSFYLQYYTSENDVVVYDVYLQAKYIYDNTIYSSVWADGSTDPYTLAYTNFYIKNNNTVVSNGVINPSQTFSGDYKDKYDNDIDNQEDVNNISEAIDDTVLDDSEVDNMLSEFNTSGDILDSLGYSPLENPFTTVILDVITQLTDVLLGSGNVTLDISAFDLEMVLHSESFVLPNGLIKIFVSLVSNGFMIWIIYKYGFKLYMEINTGKFKNLIDETTNTNINLF